MARTAYKGYLSSVLTGIFNLNMQCVFAYVCIPYAMHTVLF